MSKSNNYREFLGKLEQIEFTDKDGINLIGGGFTVEFTTNFDYTVNTKQPLQLVVNVMYKGVRVAFWGCENLEDTQAFIRFFALKTRDIFNKDMNHTDAIRKQGKEYFETGNLYPCTNGMQFLDK